MKFSLEKSGKREGSRDKQPLKVYTGKCWYMVARENKRGDEFTLGTWY